MHLNSIEDFIVVYVACLFDAFHLVLFDWSEVTIGV